MKPESALDIHIHLLGLTLSAACEAQFETESRELCDTAAGIFKLIHEWDESLSELVHQPGLGGCDPTGRHLRTWLYCQRIQTILLMAHASTRIPAVRLAVMCRAMVKEPWPCPT